MIFSTEEQLLIAVARLRPDAERIGACIRAGVDWSEVVVKSKAFGLQPLIYQHLSDQRIRKDVPEAVFSIFERQYRIQTMTNLRILGQFEEIQHALHRMNIPLIPLKGVYLAKRIYTDFASRPMADIDVLYRREDREVIEKVMAELGYGVYTIKYRCKIHEEIVQRGHLPPFEKPNRVGVEFHDHIYPGGVYNKAWMDNVWDAARWADENGGGIYYLSPDDLLFHLCLHLRQHLAAEPEVLRLYWFCDIHEVVCRYGSRIDWGRLRDRLRSQRLERPLFTILNTMKTIWDTPVPEDFLSDFETGMEKLYIIEALKDKKVLLRYILSNVRLLRRIGSIKSNIIFISRIFFPREDFMRHRYNLDKEVKLWRYYLIHPFAVLGKFMNGVCGRFGKIVGTK